MKKLLIYLMLMQAALAYSQKQNNIWYFGFNAGLDFNSGTPIPLTDGALFTWDGSTCVSNNDGEILYYSNGVTVFNKNHVIMENGEGLMGSESSTQGSLSIKVPGSVNRYYLFTVGAMEGPIGMYYSEIDMAANNGLGAVTAIKNVPMMNVTTEGITGTLHSNGDDLWVVARSFPGNSMYSFKVSAQGVSAPVISSVGPVFEDTGFFDQVSHMKISPTSNKLAVSSLGYGCVLYDFDNTTGAITNPVTLQTGSGSGVEFSMSGNVLYTTGAASLRQYNLQASNIPASGLDIVTLQNATLQLASDGKIYKAENSLNALTVINNPEVLGTGCDVQIASVGLDSGLSILGLPNFITAYYVTPDFSAQNFCVNSTTEFSFMWSIVPDTVAWDFGDGTTSTEVNPSHSYTAAGTYTVKVTATKNGIDYSRQHVITIIPLPEFTLPETYTACIASAITIATEAHNFDPVNAAYAWTFNGQPIAGNTASLVATGFGEYTVTITAGGCATTKTTTVMQPELSVTFTEGCQNYDYILSAHLEEGTEESTAVFSWEGPGGFTAGQQHITITQPGPYFVTITTQQGCIVQHDYEVVNASCPEPFIPKGISPNSDGFNDEFDLTGLNVKHLSIFNRYGLEVYTYNDYVAQWYGQTNNGDQLPDGTYYFLINKEDGQNKTGWVYINRQQN
ncbi:T9SS type B sorting domain-containing protein [Flavobacterium zepuense]|uniref:T9SS type B sorting domain-containing protein n=1 Tax=Flavobacterium zepuense TaxID=2593302 RepID=A0A552UWG8_9FLAO|nr:gliding motility-associated C-terminal domain-containing protein [Flavobacterium zepuense]TRW22547.1 T9SS type B sorting domain-containing protein [Flavobacterium zepuense]